MNFRLTDAFLAVIERFEVCNIRSSLPVHDLLFSLLCCSRGSLPKNGRNRKCWEVFNFGLLNAANKKF